MKLTDILQSLHRIQQANRGISPVYICGGIPRDKVIGNVKNRFDDLDLTTGDSSVRYLAEEFAVQMSKLYSMRKKVSEDGHVSVYLDNLKIDFSSNNVSAQAEAALRNRGVEHPTDLQLEMISRDFTCNALLLNINLRDVLDPTGRGLKDIQSRMIRTCLDPHDTFMNDTKRISRLYYIAAKLDFNVDPEIIKWIRSNAGAVRNSKDKYITEKINKAMELNPKRTVELLDATGIWKYLPPLPSLQPYMKGRG